MACVNRMNQNVKHCAIKFNFLGVSLNNYGADNSSQEAIKNTNDWLSFLSFC